MTHSEEQNMLYEVYMRVERNKEIEVVRYVGEGNREKNIDQAVGTMKDEMEKFGWEIG